MIKKINSKPVFIITAVLAYLAMVALNFLTPIMADDFTYTFKTGSFATIFHDEYLHYLTTNGRSVAHIMVRFFLLLPKVVFNLVNPLVFIIVTYLIYRLANSSVYKFNTVRYVFVVMTYFLFVPKFGETTLWETGTINYLWTMGLMLGLLLIYHKFVVENKELKIPFPAVVIFLFGVIAGWCNENTSGGLLLLTISYILIYWKENGKKIKPWMISGFVGEIIGFIVMLNSPGNKIRSAKFERYFWPFPKKVIVGTGDISRSLLNHAMPLLILTIISIVFCIFLYKKKFNYLLGILYFLIGGLTIYSLCLSPAAINWGRSYFGGIVFILVAFNIAFPTFENNHELDKVTNAIFCSMYVYLGFLAFFTFVPATLDIFRSYSLLNQRYHIILSEKEKGNLNPVVPDFNFSPGTDYPGYSIHLSHLGEDPKKPDNIYTASYFGVKTVKAIPTAEWQEKYGKKK